MFALQSNYLKVITKGGKVNQFKQAGNKAGSGNAVSGSFATALAANDANNVKVSSAASVKKSDAKQYLYRKCPVRSRRGAFA